MKGKIDSNFNSLPFYDFVWKIKESGIELLKWYRERCQEIKNSWRVKQIYFRQYAFLRLRTTETEKKTPRVIVLKHSGV